MTARRGISTTGGLNASHDGDAAGYDARRRSGWMFRRRIEFTMTRLDASAGDVLEIGAGTGNTLCALAAARPERLFIGVEPLPNYVEFATERAQQLGLTNVEFLVGTAEALPVARRRTPFGLILSTDTLHHMHDEREAARQLAAATAPGAHWLAMEPNRLNLYMAAYHRFAAGERNFDASTFLVAAQSAGWQPVGRHYLFLIPGGVERPPTWAQRIERSLEGIAPVGAGVALDLVRTRTKPK